MEICLDLMLVQGHFNIQPAFRILFFIRFIFNPEHIWKSNLESLTDLFFQLVWQDGYKRSAQERFSRIFSSILSWLDNWTQQGVIRRMFFFFKHGNIPEHICIQQPWVLDWPIFFSLSSRMVPWGLPDLLSTVLHRGGGGGRHSKSTSALFAPKK